MGHARRTSGRRMRAAALAVGVVATLGLASAAHAATVTVTETVDWNDGHACIDASGCTLRNAIAIANATPGTTILVPPGRYLVTGSALVLSGDDTTIQGTGDTQTATIISGFSDSDRRTLYVTGAGIELDNLALTDGTAPTLGGRLDPGNGGNLVFRPTSSSATLILSEVTVAGGTASGYGGGIFVVGGTLALLDSIVHTNSAASGAGLFAGGGQVVVDGSTFTRNTGSGAGPNGGAVAVNGASAAIINSTLYANSAVGGIGGAIALINNAGATLLNATIARNQSTGTQDVAVGSYSGLTAVNTTIGVPGAGGTVSGLAADSDHACGIHDGGTMTATIADDHSLSSDTSCGFSVAHGSIVGADPMFLALGDYGGPTPTLAYGPTSPLIDAGNSNPAVCPEIDQRYAPRPYGNGCDIGALESPYPLADPGSGSGSGGTPGGGGGGGGSSSSATSATPTAPTEAPAPAPTATPSPAPVTTPAPPVVAPAKTTVLSRTGRLVVLAKLPGTPAGRVTLTWTVRKGDRVHRGTAQVTAVAGTVARTLSLPRALRGGRLVRVVATWTTKDGKAHRLVL
jgi:hypothetical protein